MAPQGHFLTLFLQHQSDLRAFLGSLVRNRQDFEDILQETVLTLWEKFDEYDSTRSFGAWARGVAANKILQWRHRSGRTPTPFSPTAIRAIVEAFANRPSNTSEVADALEECLKHLPTQSQEVLSRWYAGGWSIDRVAEHLGATTTAAYKTLQRLRMRLLECVQRRLATVREVS